MAWDDPDTLRARFSTVCDVPITDMAPRGDGVRHCSRCARDVHPARSAEEFDALARAGACVYAFSTRDDVLVAAPTEPPDGEPVRREPPATAGVPFDPERFKRVPVPVPVPDPAPEPVLPQKKARVLLPALVGIGIGLGLGWYLFE